MKKNRVFLAILVVTLPQAASGWEWQLASGPWTLQPLTSPVERQAERIISVEAARILAPLLSEFRILAIEPKVDLRSRGFFFSAGFWRRLAMGRLSLGASASYLDLTLPFTLEDERNIYFQDLLVASVSTHGEGKIKLRTFMMEARGRWLAFRSGRLSAYAGLGLSALRFSGNLHLPLWARIDSFLGKAELRKTEDMSLSELRKANGDVPAWLFSPSLNASIHLHVGAKNRVFVEIGVSQGTFLALGVSTRS